MATPEKSTPKPPPLPAAARAVLSRWEKLGGDQPPLFTERLTEVAKELAQTPAVDRPVDLDELAVSKKTMEILSRGREMVGRRPVTLPERLEKYAREILSTPGVNLTIVVRRQVKELKSVHPITTVQRALSELRKLIAQQKPNHRAIKLLLSAPNGGIGLTAEEVKASRARSRLNTVMNQAQRRPIHNPEQLVKTARTGLKSDHWPTLAASVLLLTGRRATEILQSGQFALTTPPHRHKLRFKGQLKTRKAEGTRQGYYTIDVLASPAALIQALARLRELLPTKGLSYREINSKLSELRKAANAMFAGWRTKDLRAINAKLSYHAFAPQDMDPLVYFAKQLGHKRLEAEQPGDDSAADADTMTAAYYLQFYIPQLDAHSRLKI